MFRKGLRGDGCKLSQVQIIRHAHAGLLRFCSCQLRRRAQSFPTVSQRRYVGQVDAYFEAILSSDVQDIPPFRPHGATSTVIYRYSILERGSNGVQAGGEAEACRAVPAEALQYRQAI